MQTIIACHVGINGILYKPNRLDIVGALVATICNIHYKKVLKISPPGTVVVDIITGGILAVYGTANTDIFVVGLEVLVLE